jgi:uncharacterized protein YndB with AHSA1/START domain
VTKRHGSARIDPVVAALAERQPTDATLTLVAGGWVLTMTRELAHEVGRVWAKLTEPEELRKWSPVVPDRPLTSPGRASARERPDLEAVDAEVLVSDRPRELVHRWGPHVLRWTLAPTAEGCRLTLEQTFDDAAQRGSFAAGWHLCLAVLAALLDGHTVERVVGSRALDYNWRTLEARYRKSLELPTELRKAEQERYGQTS